MFTQSVFLCFWKLCDSILIDGKKQLKELHACYSCKLNTCHRCNQLRGHGRDRGLIKLYIASIDISDSGKNAKACLCLLICTCCICDCFYDSLLSSLLRSIDDCICIPSSLTESESVVRWIKRQCSVLSA